jgi:exodeoxyribonuclease V
MSDIQLTEEQLQAIDEFSKWYRNGKLHGFENYSFKLAGPAGTGKSTIAKYALENIGYSTNHQEVAKVAYTGKAALVMQQKGLDGAQTIHSAIYIPKEDIADAIKNLRNQLMVDTASLNSSENEDEKKILMDNIEYYKTEIALLQDKKDDELTWLLNPGSVLYEKRIIICDEASMVGGDIQKDLESFGVPVLYLGDQFQLSPISESKLDSVFFDSRGNTLDVNFTLTQIHRQAEGNPIIRYSRALRENRLREINFFGKETGVGTLLRVNRNKLSMEHLARAEQIIVGKNDTRHDINYYVREQLGRDSPYPQINDKIIFLKNNKNENVVNGMLGSVLSDADNFSEKSGSFKAKVLLETGEEKNSRLLTPYFSHPGDKDEIYRQTDNYSRKIYLHADYAYAITCHKCITLDTIVHTSNGIFQIGELDNNATVGEFRPFDSDIQACNGFSLEKVNAFYNNGESNTLKITTKKGFELKATDEHRFFVLSKDQLIIEKFAKDLTIDDYLVIPRQTTGFGTLTKLNYVNESGYHNEIKYTLPDVMTPELAEVLGMLVADGSITGKKINYCKHEREPVDRFAKLIKILFNYNAKVVDRSKNGFTINDYMCEVYSTCIKRFFENFDGLEPNNKNVPLAIRMSNKECQRVFLRGIVEDGTVNVKKGKFDHIEIIMKYENLFRYVRAMLHNFGILSSKYIDIKGYYRIMIYREFGKIFKNEIGFLSPSKQNALQTVDENNIYSNSIQSFPYLGDFILKILLENNVPYNKIFHNEIKNGKASFNKIRQFIEVYKDKFENQEDFQYIESIYHNFTFDKIIKIEDNGNQKTVCLQMSESGSFVQNGILAGNSQGSSYNSGIVIEEPLGRTDELRRRWRYTAITRFSNSAIIAA